MFREHLETPDELLVWARSKEPNEYVGKSGDPCNCPVARFLMEIGAVPEGERISVGISSIGIIQPEDLMLKYYPEYMPSWAKQILFEVDALERTQIPAELFLTIVINKAELYQDIYANRSLS